MATKTNGYSHVKAGARKAKKQNDADKRQAKYDSLTIAEKIALAVSRGGSKKELAKLMNPKPKKVEQSAQAPVQSVNVVEQSVSGNKYRKGKKSKVNKANKENRPSKS